MDKLIQRRLEVAELVNKLSALKNRTAAQNTDLDNAIEEFERLTAEIERQDRAANVAATLSTPQRRRTSPGSPGVPASRAEAELDGWVRNLAANPEAIRNAAGTYAGETTGADGGFLAPPEYSRTLEVLLKGPASLLGLCEEIITTSNSIVLPTDEDPPWSAAGIAAADVAEGAAYGQTKPVVKNVNVILGKTGVLVPVSEELLADGVNVGGYVAQKSADKLAWRLNAKAFSAFMASGAKIVAPKTSGSAAGSPPDMNNVLEMFGNIPAALRDSAVWLANPRLQGVMMTWTIGQTPVFVPGGSLANSPNDKLLGKPIIWTELCSAIGAEGDLMLVAPKAFYAVTKGQPKAAVSAHLFFDQDLVAFKCNARVAIKSKFSALITRPDGTKVGNVATLAAR